MPYLTNKKIILAVSGGIAAYKICELIRLLRKEQSEVRVLMTKNAERFVAPLSFATLSGNSVLRELGEGYDMSATPHIDLAQWGDLFLAAPATANFIAKLAAGICDDAPSTEALAFQGPILLAPAMNMRMWEADATKANLKKLKKRGIYFVGPEKGDLACGETGLGKMSEVATILQSMKKILLAKESSSKKNVLKNKKVLVTSGPTRSYIDSMRFITNRSSGQMGHSIAIEAEKLGAEVTLITGAAKDPSFNCLRKAEIYPVETNEEMLSICLSTVPHMDIIFSVAAVCDFEMKSPIKEKIKRKKNLNLQLKATQDIISTLTKNKKPHQVFIAFAAEEYSQKELFKKAIQKLEKKGVDLIAMNDISRKDIAFDSNENELYVFDKNKKYKPKILQKKSKTEIAKELIHLSLQCQAK